jgi:hypothetical protein
MKVNYVALLLNYNSIHTKRGNMKKLIILAGLLMASQALASDEQDVSPEKVKNDVKQIYLRCNMKDAIYSSNRTNSNLKNLENCKREIDALITKAVNGDDAIFDGLQESINGDAMDLRHKAFNESYLEKLQIESQRALMKSQEAK